MNIRNWITGLAAVGILPFAAHADVFDVTTPDEIRLALLTAEANGEDDTINVAAGTYALTETLRYQASGGEDFAINILGADSTTTILDAGSNFPVLRIDTNTGGASLAARVTVSGLTIRNGSAMGSGGMGANGGGLFVTTEVGGVSIVASEFFNNQAGQDGGAIYVAVTGISEDAIELRDLSIDGNAALGLGGGGGGGGAHVSASQFAGVNVFDIDFINNTAANNGGGLEIEGSDADDPFPVVPRVANVAIDDVLFRGNSITGADGVGGGADLAANQTTVTRSGFVDNTSALGGGLHVRDGLGFNITNTGFAGNQAIRAANPDHGGGLAVIASMAGVVTLTNNTFSGNSATDFGGAAYLVVGGSTGLANVYNNIFWDSFQEVGDLYVDDDPFTDIPATVMVFNNDFVDFTTKCLLDPGCTANVSQGNNLSVDPMLTDPALRPDPDPHLAAGSPMIDAGDNTAPGIPGLDYEGEARIFDGNGDLVATVDIGMDEALGGGAPPQEVDLAVTLTDAPDPVVSSGEQLTYTVTVSNVSTVDATSVEMMQTLPAGVTFVSASAGSGTCAAGTGSVTCTWAALAGSASENATVVVDPAAVTTDMMLTSMATVQASETDSNAANNSAMTTTTVTPPAADISVGISGPTTDPSVGDSVTYTVTVSNAGPSSQTNTSVVVTLPDEVVFVSATADQGSGCTETMGVVSCQLGDLADGASSVTTVVVQAPDVDATFTVTTEVAGDVGDAVSANNTASFLTNVVSTIDLIIRAEAGGGSVGLFALMLLAVAGLMRRVCDRKLGVDGQVGVNRQVGVIRQVGVLFAGLAAATAGGTAWAIDVEDIYVGGSYGGATANYDEADLTGDLAARGWTINTVSVDDKDDAWKAFIGASFVGHFGVELAWVDLGQIESRFGATIRPDQIDALLTDTSEVHESLADGIAFSGLARFPVGERVDLFGRVGAFFWDAETEVWVESGGTGRVTLDDSGTGLVIGAGGAFQFSEKFGARLEWERYDVQDWVDVYTVGVFFKF